MDQQKHLQLRLCAFSQLLQRDFEFEQLLLQLDAGVAISKFIQLYVDLALCRCSLIGRIVVKRLSQEFNVKCCLHQCPECIALLPLLECLEERYQVLLKEVSE